MTTTCRVVSTAIFNELSLAFHSRQAGRRHHVPHHRRQFRRADDANERFAADHFGDRFVARMLVILFPLDPVLTVLSMSVVPVLFLLIGFFNRRIADVATDVRDADSRRNSREIPLE
jgi:ABC-type multidrug transport system fused ATPase/permease subunit